ncbi:MAG: RNA-binding S4 domain-containing protein [Armatimonadetes bacterium]|nr:RNA-binding S4 domain-containing protein [Armatimonadota bacterium]
MRVVTIRGDSITLAAFLKWAGIASTGGMAKVLITSGRVRVNGEVEARRGRTIRPGDVVEVDGARFSVVTDR